MALNSEDGDKSEHDKVETELSAYAQCNGLVVSQSNVDGTSASRQQTAHDWEGYKTMDKDFYDDGTITFFWYVYDIFVFIVQCQICRINVKTFWLWLSLMVFTAH